MTQADVAERLGISQSDVSKLERRTDLKLSTLRDYLAALDLPLRLIAGAGVTEVELSLGDCRSALMISGNSRFQLHDLGKQPALTGGFPRSSSSGRRNPKIIG